MTRHLRNLIAMLAAATAAATVGACSNPSSPTGRDRVPLTQVQTGAWTLATVQPPGQAAVAPPMGSNFGLEVVDGRAAIVADCNRCSGAAALGESTLTVGPLLACTRAYCASAPFDDAFTRMLAGEHAATLDGNTLSLSSDRGVLRFRR